ncbi:nascent polypeptide-associated alpha subunit [Phaffia rhodozyma]|uniref:Nascent polypeptide-associated complex subunit alpha n=1 Tax=Phaffia rhodozyma TaxID=264483 RepID=A0A0F7SJD4_PHARH|nr:nascent polypeptide-associated alpha subunit [Phaffia rhodozyma]
MASIEELSLSDKEEESVPTLVESEDSGVQSRSERKARKALANLGLKKVAGITRVTIRRPKNVLYVINNPEVFKSGSADVHIVFGEAKIEDQSHQAQMAAAQQLAQSSGLTGEEEEGEDIPELEGIQPKEPSSAPASSTVPYEVDDKDVEILMSQANCTREKAEEALKKSNGDLINAILEASE